MKFDILTQTNLIYKLRELGIPYTAESDTVGVEIIIKESDLDEDIEEINEDGEKIFIIGKFDFVFGQGFKLKSGAYRKHFPRLTLK